jgi:hypothetical protein
MEVLIGGDLFVSEEFEDKNLLSIEVIDLFKNADYRILNLESPICEDNVNNKIIKTGPHLRTSSHAVIPVLKRLSVDLVTMANNHILDYGTKGLKETFEILNKFDIGNVGAGNNLYEAQQLYTIEKNGIRIAILNFAENEWSIAEEDKAGANPLDIIDNVNQIKAAKATHDKVICIIHGGHEYYHLPSLRMVKQYRFYADNGADAIINHHTHCIGGHEVYKNTPIVYSLGNFLFTYDSNYESWYNGLLSKLSIAKDGPINLTLIPIRQLRTNFLLRLLDSVEEQAVFEQIFIYNKIIAVEKLLRTEWENFISSKQGITAIFSPLSSLSGRFIKSINYRFGVNQIILGERFLKTIFNYIRCEAHRDLMTSVLKNKFNQY